MPEADLVLRTRMQVQRGVVEMVVWRVPRPVPPSQHNFKYRLVYLRNGVRLVGFDNERGKGDHLHKGSREVAYRFTDIETLLADFMAEVERLE